MRHICLTIDKLAHKIPFCCVARMLTWLSVQFGWLPRPFNHLLRGLLRTIHLRFSLGHNCDTHFVLTFCFARWSSVNNFDLISVRIGSVVPNNLVRLRNLTRWLHVEVARFILVLAIVIDAWLVKILVKILHRVVYVWVRVIFLLFLLTTYNALIIILIKKLNKRIIWHIISCLNETFSLQLYVWFLRQELLIKCLLHLDWCANFIRIKIAHIRKTHSKFLCLSLVKISFFKSFLRCVSPGNKKTFTFINFKLCVENLWVHIVLLSELWSKKLFDSFNSPEFHILVFVFIQLVFNMYNLNGRLLFVLKFCWLAALIFWFWFTVISWACWGSTNRD